MVAERPVVYVQMLNGLSLRCGDIQKSYHIRARRNWQVIAYLLLHRDRAVTRDELIGLFPESAYSTDANRMFRNRLLRIKRCLAGLSELAGGDLIVTCKKLCRWNPDIQIQIDVDDFLEQCANIKSGETPVDQAVAVRKGLRRTYGKGFLPMFDCDKLQADRMAYSKVCQEAANSAGMKL